MTTDWTPGITTSVQYLTDSGEPCVFPFKYRGRLCSGCINKDHDKYWCGTQRDNNGGLHWGNCPANAPKVESCTIRNTTTCIFPFHYEGLLCSGCITDDHQTYWCVTYGKNAKLRWTICPSGVQRVDLCQSITTTTPGNVKGPL